MTVSRGEVGQEGAAPVSDSSAWGPFRSRDFTRMASAQFVSNVGGWMQTVGAGADAHADDVGDAGGR